MRRLSVSVVLLALVAIVFGAFPQLIAASRGPIAGNALPRLKSLIGLRAPAAQQGDQGNAQGPSRPKPVATVATDKDDYHPYEQVFITGSGWLPRELVELTITEVATDPPGGWMDGPFLYYASADSRGNIENSDFWTDEHDAGVSFLLTAKGVISGRTAQTAFTDGVGSLAQCANGNPLDPTPCQSASEWVSGNLGASKSTYLEGDSIPYRLTMSGLSTSGSHTVTIEWDTTKSGKHALDYITTFNRTSSVGTSNPCAGIAGCGSPTTYPIPQDTFVTAAGVTPVAGNFTLYGGTITALSGYTLSGTYAGDSSTRITLTFTASTANPVLAWGGHIATRLDWGAVGSAVAISGSPYHTRLVEIDGSGGNQDRSLSADAVIFPGSIRITKNAVPDHAQDFGFTTTGGLSPASFSLDDDSDPTLPNFKLYSTITNFTQYTISETAVSGWALSFASPVCSVSTPNGGSQSGSGSTLTVNLKEGEDVSCTLTNTLVQPTLKLVKTVVNDNGGDKAVSDFVLKIDGSTVTSGLAIGVTAGPHTASEVNLSGYSAGNWGGDCAVNGSVTLAPGENKVCTITNDDQAATLTVIKHVVNDNGGTKTAANFTMNVTGTNVQPAASFAGAEAPGTTVTLNAGSYSVDEGTVSGYTKTIGANCSGSIANGEAKTCTITNDDQAATLTVIKHVVNDNGGTKTAGNFTMNVTGTNVQPAASFAGAEAPGTTVTLSAGSYSVDEGTVSGYTKTIGANCSGSIANGEAKTCTITNDDQAATLTVIKHVVNDNGGAKTAANFTMNVTGTNVQPAASFAGAEAPGTTVTLNAGSYSVDEGTVSGYTKTIGANCSGSIANGEAKTCTITNDDQAATLTVIKHVVNDNGGTKTAANFTMNVTGTNVQPAASFAGAEAPGTTVTLSAGSYSVDEGTVSGYTKTIGANCSGSIANGEVKTCTITNDDQAATLTVIKHVVNDNGGTKTAANFTMNVTGTNVQPAASFAGAESPGTTVTLNAGSYSVDEGPVSGYTKTIGANCSGTIANGEAKTCTITNDDQAATLIVIKHVINDNGGTRTAANFTMNVTGTNVQPLASFPGVESPGTLVTLNAGGYSVDETPVTGYTKTIGANCSGSIANGETKTCTITNNDDKASPGITTTQTWVLKDSATLSNFRTGAGDNGSATMVFTLYGPDAACTTTPIHTETITGVATVGAFKTPLGKEVTVAGTYRWLVSYSGDSRNNPITSQCGEETHTITVGEPQAPPQP